MLRWRLEWPFTVLVGIAWIALLPKADAASPSSMVHMRAVSNLVGQHGGHVGQVAPLEPPQLAGATEAPVVLVGEPASVSLTIPVRSRSLVAAAAADRTHQLFVGVEDIEAEQDPGLAYAVYLAGPGGQRRHLGNLSFFGIHTLSDPDRAHLGAPGFRHTFDASGAVDSLRREGAFDAGSITVTFEPIRVVPPLGRDTAAAFEAAAPTPPVRIGRVSLFILKPRVGGC